MFLFEANIHYLFHLKQFCTIKMFDILLSIRSIGSVAELISFLSFKDLALSFFVLNVNSTQSYLRNVTRLPYFTGALPLPVCLAV